MSNFAGTAKDYDEYRPGVPDEVRDVILAAVPSPVTLLDLGCGTGRVTEQFASHFSETIAIEPDRDMAKIARHRLEKLPVTIMHTRAEDMQLPEDWQASLVTVARAFHWMNRPVVLSKLASVTAKDGVVALFWDSSFWGIDDEWAVQTRKLVHTFLGPERQTLTGRYQPPSEPFEAALEESVFTEVTKHVVPVVRHWTREQIAGYLRSTSFASQAVMGTKADAFEKELHQLLAQLSPNDSYVEHNHFNIILAKRPPLDVS